MHQGNLASRPISAPLKDGIFELRARAGKVQARLLFFFQPGKRIIFAVSTIKKKSKVPEQDIDKAKNIRDALLAEPELMDELTKIH